MGDIFGVKKTAESVGGATQAAFEGFKNVAAGTKDLGPPKLPSFDKPIEDAKAKETKKAKRFGGTGSTILTGALGLPGAAVTQRKTLLGQ